MFRFGDEHFPALPADEYNFQPASPDEGFKGIQVRPVCSCYAALVGPVATLQVGVPIRACSVLPIGLFHGAHACDVSCSALNSLLE